MGCLQRCEQGNQFEGLRLAGQARAGFAGHFPELPRIGGISYETVKCLTNSCPGAFREARST